MMIVRPVMNDAMYAHANITSMNGDAMKSAIEFLIELIGDIACHMIQMTIQIIHIWIILGIICNS